MSYSWDKFIKPVTSTDTNVQIIDNLGKVNFTINPFAVVNVFVNNNLVKVSLRSGRTISIPFSSIRESKLALPRIKQAFDSITQKTPLFIQKDIKNYINSVVSSGTGSYDFFYQDSTPTASNISIGALWYDTTDGQLYVYVQSGVWAAPLSEIGPTGPAGATGSTASFYYQSTTPTGTGTSQIPVGSFWYDDLGTLYVYVEDPPGTYQWVTPINEIGPTGPTGATGTGGPGVSVTFSSIDSHLIPATGSVYDIGATAGYEWRDLYLSGNTIYLGDSVIQSTNSTVAFGSISIGGPTSSGGVLLSAQSGQILFNQQQFLGLDFTDGLQIQGNTVSLGGTLSSQLDLIGDSNDLSFTQFGNMTFTSSVFDVISDFISIDSTNVMQVLADSDITINSGSQLALAASSSSITISDGVGLVYSSDYSGGFVDRSLVDKAFVDTATSSIWSYLSTIPSGTSGTSGINGSSGTSGINGSSGTSGINGSSGTSGINGSNGTSGSSGNNGSNGTSGSSGQSPTTDWTLSGGLTVGGTSSLNGLTVLQEVTEVINSTPSATSSNVVYDFNIGTNWYHSSATTNYTANFNNVPIDNNRAITVTIVINQGATAYIPHAVQINGVSQTIKWSGGTASGTSNQVDIVGFTFIRSGGAWAQVLGQINTFD